MALLRRLALLGFLVSCTSSATGDGQPSVKEVHSAAYTKVTVEVDYQTGAAPYSGSAGPITDIWQIARDNATRAFKATNKTVTIASDVGAMEEITGSAAAAYRNDAILAIADAHRNTKSGDGTATYYVVFLNGLYDDGSGPQSDVLGVSIGTTGVVAMFKPVIAGAGGLPGITKVLEQSVLVHELGHAFGLVNDGLAAQSAHEDTAHGHHCTNEACVMNWSAERVSSAVAVAKAYLASGQTVLYDASCLADLDAAR